MTQLYEQQSWYIVGPVSNLHGPDCARFTRVKGAIQCSNFNHAMSLRNAQDDYLLRRILFSATEVHVHPTNMVRDHIAGGLFLYATVCGQHRWQQGFRAPLIRNHFSLRVQIR